LSYVPSHPWGADCKKQKHKNMNKTRFNLGILAAALAALLLVSGSPTAKAAYTRNLDAVLFFEDINQSADVVMLGLPTLSGLRDATAGTYTILNSGGESSLASALSTAYGATWATDGTVLAGVAGSRSASNVNDVFGATQDPYRTLYFSQARATTSSAGSQDSGDQSLPGNTTLGSAASGIDTVEARLAGAGTQLATFTNASSTGFFGQVPADGGNSFNSQITSVAGLVSTSSFTFGAAGSNVVLAMDMYRMKPSNSPVGELDPSVLDLNSQFLGQVILKDTGEVGFVAAVPEPTTIGMLGLVAVGGAIAAVRRRKAAKA
jgi:hypothetical protein